jgi:uncharacterized protein YggE
MENNTPLMLVGIALIIVITAGVTFYAATVGTALPPGNCTNGTSETPTITVRGEATMDAPSDLLSIGLSVEGEGANVSESQAAAARQMSDLKTALLAGGVKESEIRTNSYYSYPVYNDSCKRCYEPYGYGQEASPDSTGVAESPAYPCDYDCYNQMIGYKTVHSIEVSTEKVNDGGDIIDAAVQANGTRLDYVYFTLKESTRISLEEQVQGQAAASARGKADNIAQGVGATVGKLVSIQTEGYYPYPYYNEGAVYDSSGGAMPPTEIFPGDTTISSTVVVVYELEQ